VPSKHTAGEMHHKNFYFTSVFSGTIFDFGFGPNPIDHETSSPIWLPLKLFKTVLFGGHQRGLTEVLKHLCQDRDLFFIIEKANLLP